jgi:hypothetical protein
MMKKLFVVMMAGLLILPAAAFGAEFQKGARTFTLGGSGSSENDLDSSSISTGLSVGYFIKDNIEIVLRQQLNFFGDQFEDWNGSTRIGADYYFDMDLLRGRLKPLVPFVGVNAGYRYGDGVDSNMILCPETGLKFFFNSSTFLQMMLEYEIILETDFSELEDTISDGRFIYSIGLGFKF